MSEFLKQSLGGALTLLLKLKCNVSMYELMYMPTY